MVKFCGRLADQAGEQFMEEHGIQALVDNGFEKQADGRCICDAENLPLLDESEIISKAVLNG
jgi:hypothetical protein